MAGIYLQMNLTIKGINPAYTTTRFVLLYPITKIHDSV